MKSSYVNNSNRSSPAATKCDSPTKLRFNLEKIQEYPNEQVSNNLLRTQIKSAVDHVCKTLNIDLAQVQKMQLKGRKSQA